MEREGCSESMLNYSATATQVVTCSRCFLQRFNPGPRDSIWAFYSLLGAVAMGLCMLRRARCTVHGKQFACADWESKVGAESVRSRLKKPHREHKHDETRFDSATFYCIFFYCCCCYCCLPSLMSTIQHCDYRRTVKHGSPCVWGDDLVEL